ncbi:MAG: hypothetical protein HKN47_15895 [Pirellulaceae bacterium]|nr:hypothetical protein [Pirellulaceae bacterium]
MRCPGFVFFYVASFLLLITIAGTAIADGPLILASPDRTPIHPPDTQQRLPATRHTTSFAISEAQARSSIQWLAELAIRKSPRVYQGDKDWGETKGVWLGMKWKRDGLLMKADRRIKELRHGRWIKYELILPEAGKETDHRSSAVVATIHRVMKTGDLQTGIANTAPTNAHWQIESSVVAPMRFTARVERWNRGVQWYSLSVNGKMRVQLDSIASLAFLADYAEVPPALVIDPKIQNAVLHLKDFEVDRVSKIGGDVAEEWGEMMERVVRDVFLKKQNERLVGKLNQSIDKSRDDLRLSMADWFATW